MGRITFADGTIISDFQKPYVIAEVNSSHNGNIDIAKDMIDVAVEAGCDCVKFQSWTTKSLYSTAYYKANPIAKRFVDKLSLSPKELKACADYCKEKGIAFSSTPYSREEVDFLVNECEVPFIKISSMEENNPEFIRYIAEKGLPIVLSTGMSDFDEVRKAVAVIESCGNTNIAILHCVSLYPTPMERVNLLNIETLREMYPKYPIGFSDHTLGDAAAVASVVLGAAVIEKHITLDAKKIGMDNQMAMEPEPLRAFVKKCKGIRECLGQSERVLYEEEIKQRNNMRRSIVLVHDMKAGEVIKREDLDVKRPGTGLAPVKMEEIIGKRLLNDVEEDMLLSESDFN